MPHKRAKRSVREADKQAKGRDLVPTGSKIEQEDMPKGAMRILMAGKMQEAYRKRKREGGEEEEGTAGKGKVKSKGKAADLALMPGERLKDFNKRVDQTLRAGINAAISSSTSNRAQKRARKAAKETGVETSVAPSTAPQSTSKSSQPAQPTITTAAAASDDYAPAPAAASTKPKKQRATDFASAERLRLNDIAQAPPTLPKMRAAAKAKSESAGRRVGLGLVQSVKMEEERERVIKAYRSLKAQKIAERGG